MTPIFNPATETATVLQCLLISKGVSKKINQDSTFVTFNLAMAKIACNIIWQSPDKFKNVIVHLGGFHIVYAYMGATGKIMTGSRFEEILTDSNVCASGLINQVMSGKQYNRAFPVHHLMQDAVNRLVIWAFMEKCGRNVNELQEFQALIDEPCFSNIKKFGSVHS